MPADAAVVAVVAEPVSPTNTAVSWKSSAPGAKESPDIRFADTDGDEITLRREGGRVDQYVNGKMFTEGVRIFRIDAESRTYKDDKSSGTIVADVDAKRLRAMVIEMFQLAMKATAASEAKGQWLSQSMSNLKNHMRTRGISMAGCSEKEHFVDRLIARLPSSPSSKQKLPPIKQKHPLNFDDLYVMSRRRVQSSHAAARQGGTGKTLASTGQLPRLPGKKAGWLPQSMTMSGGMSMSQSCGALPWAPGEASWASQCLQSMPKVGVTAMEEDAGTVTAPVAGGEISQTVPLSSQGRRPSIRPVSGLGGVETVESQTADSKGAARPKVPSADDGDWRKPRSSTKEMISQVAEEDLDRPLTDVEIILKGPSMKDIKERALDDGFSDYEMGTFRQAFKRWKVPSTEEIHKDDLGSYMSALGYLKAEDEQIMTIAAEVSEYGTLTFTELCSFIEKFAMFERDEFRNAFQKSLEPGKEEVSTAGLEGLVRSLGITPFRETLAEVLDVVDQDKSGSIDFVEFVFMLATYRLSEGFTRQEVMELHRVFERFGEERKLTKEEQGYPGTIIEIEVNELRNALLHMFGPQAYGLAAKLAEQVGCRKRNFAEEQDMTRYNADVEGDNTAAPPRAPSQEKRADHPLSFHEFLGWARALREAEIQEYLKQYNSFDTTGDGRLMTDELPPLFKKLGYTPLAKTMEELVGEVDVTNDGSIDFDEFVHLMATFRSTDGFTAAEGKELRNAFDFFDDGTTGEIESLQLLDLLRHLGYLTNLDTARRFVKQVDFNESHSLDFREFLRLMRLHREEELSHIQTLFDNEAEDTKAGHGMPASILRDTMTKLTYSEADLEMFPQMLTELEIHEDEMLTFDRLVEAVDVARRHRMFRLRRQAGFTDAQIEKHRERFHGYDSDGNGFIERHELNGLINDIGIPLRDIADQERFIERIQAARDRAQESGVAPEDLGERGDPCVLFWEFVHLARILADNDDKQEVAREESAVAETRFNPDEVSQFREIFEYWAVKARQLELETQGRSSVIQVEDDEDEPKPPESTVAPADVTCKHMSVDGIKRVLRSFGCFVQPSDRRELENEVERLTGAPTGRADFPDFLRLMRWMTKRNFANINSVAEKAASDAANTR